MLTINTPPISTSFIGTPYAKITVGKWGDKNADIFKVGDGKLIDYSITSSEGKGLSNTSFTILDRDRTILDKYLTYVESVQGLNPLEIPDTTTTNTLTNDVPQDAIHNGSTGKLIYASTKASVFNDKLGSRGNALDPDNVFGCAMRYNNPAAAKQFGSAGMISYLKFGDKVRVTNLHNGKSCVCQILDWGANPKYLDRGIDLFTKAFNELTGTKGYQAAVNIGILNNIKVELIESNTTSNSNATKTKEQNAQSAAKKAKTETQSPTSSSVDKVKKSIENSKRPTIESTYKVDTKSGFQITVELGFNGIIYVANSFIHTALSYDHSTRTFSFIGQAASWSMTQRIKNTAYSNVTFKQLATKITKSYNLKLEMDDVGLTYEYFPQRSISDYETLVTEANRIGYRVKTVGNAVYIKKQSTEISKKNVFKLIYGDNAGIIFNINHSASTDATGGARSATPGSSSSTGELKFELDPDSGQIKQKRKENIVGTGLDNKSTTGSSSKQPTPKLAVNQVTPDIEKENSMRVKGILADAEFPTTPDALFLTPDSPFKTEGFSKTVDRYWVVDSVTHSYDLGNAITKVSLYSPLKNKRPSPTIINPTSTTTNSVVNSEPFNTSAPKFIRPTSGVISSLHRTENPRRPNHKGIDYAAAVGTTIVASASGTVTIGASNCSVGNSKCGGGYGNWIDVNHGGGWTTRYAHLSAVNVINGQTVNQGQTIGAMGNTGHSTGSHLHFEIRKNGADVNPRIYITK